MIDKKCGSCKGYGKKVKNENIKVKIPAGVDNHTVIRLRGKGGEGRAGAPDGDLLVRINVEKHKFFKRKALNDFLYSSKNELIFVFLFLLSKIILLPIRKL